MRDNQLGNGLSTSDKFELDKACSHIKVKVIDLKKLGADLSVTAKKQMERLKDANLVISGYSSMALYKDGKKSIIFDNDLAGQIEKDGFTIELKRALVKEKQENGNEVNHVYIFPVGSFEIDADELLKYVKEETDLKTFMGERFAYNRRIVENTQGFIEYLKEA